MIESHRYHVRKVFLSLFLPVRKLRLGGGWGDLPKVSQLR